MLQVYRKDRRMAVKHDTVFSVSPAKTTVLIVDDDPDIRFLVTESLSEKGYVVAEAADGRAALSYLQDGGRPCLIFLDLMMPGMDGWEFRAEQMKNSTFSSIPVVLYTAVADPAEANRKLGTAGYVRKSMNIDEIHEWAERLCSGTSRA